jgi:hypothetical protein
MSLGCFTVTLHIHCVGAWACEKSSRSSQMHVDVSTTLYDIDSGRNNCFENSLSVSFFLSFCLWSLFFVSGAYKFATDLITQDPLQTGTSITSTQCKPSSAEKTSRCSALHLRDVTADSPLVLDCHVHSCKTLAWAGVSTRTLERAS